jgi:hypothetical protein
MTGEGAPAKDGAPQSELVRPHCVRPLCYLSASFFILRYNASRFIGATCRIPPTHQLFGGSGQLEQQERVELLAGRHECQDFWFRERLELHLLRSDLPGAPCSGRVETGGVWRHRSSERSLHFFADLRTVVGCADVPDIQLFIRPEVIRQPLM